MADDIETKKLQKTLEKLTDELDEITKSSSIESLREAEREMKSGEKLADEVLDKLGISNKRK